MNCPKCGQLVDPGAVFCGNCGQALQPVAPVQPAQPGASPVAQVYTNQSPASPTTGTFNGMAVNTGAGGMVAPPMPAYATVGSNAHNGEMKAIIGLILGVIGIPASIIPIAGLIFGITGLVLSTTARSKYKKAISIFGIVFSTLAILTALGAWVWFIAHDAKLHKDPANGASSSSSSTSSNSASLVPVDTPCYSLKIDGGLNSYKPEGCDLDSSSASEEFAIAAATNVSVNSSNLDQVGQKAVAGSVSQAKATLISEQSGQFAGSPAYIAYLNATVNGVTQNGIMAVVLHPTSSGENIFVVAHSVAGNQKVDFGTLESNWQWK
jgi:hypothetical protein